MASSPRGSILALDIGARRIGLALASRQARLASPHSTILNDASTLDGLRRICATQQVNQLVIGLPHGLNGQDTVQTMTVRALGTTYAKALNLPVHWQDEALTSVQAETELKARHKSLRNKAAVDALAAVYILEDYLREHL